MTVGDQPISDAIMGRLRAATSDLSKGEYVIVKILILPKPREGCLSSRLSAQHIAQSSQFDQAVDKTSYLPIPRTLPSETR